MILVIDNYDSFTYNLVQYFGELNQEIKVFRNDEISIEEIEELNPSHIVISPGPSEPKDAGISKSVIEYFAGKKPILGVCLGHQCMGEVFGGQVIRAPYLMHGKVSNIIYKEGEPLFKDMPLPFIATRYHSLIIEKNSLINSQLENIAWTSDNLVMAVRHKIFKNLVGIQFHPESVLTEQGRVILKNFLEL
jgi:anthranilate synthase/aminodeoxychorismate synthase-like glutamine amidotransferase